MPLHIDRRVGRLVEYALIGEMTAEEMRPFRTQVRATLGAYGARSVRFADPRRLPALSLDVMQGLLTMATHATSKQAKSMRNQSDHRGLTDIVEAGRWLDQLLHAPERARLPETVAA